MDGAADTANTFARASGAYAAARPLYPGELFEWIAGQSPARRAAWDCATGNGQAAIGLARFFDAVEATDVSEEQVRCGLACPGVAYSAQPAETTRFGDRSFDAVTVAQALHWFDLPRFWAEVRRVSRPDALFCAWGYAWFRYPAEVEEALVAPVRALVEPFWAANNRLLWDGYRDADLGFPFEQLAVPPFSIVLDTNAAGIADYLRTWSAFKRAADAGPELAEALEDRLDRGLAALGRGLQVRAVGPLTVVAGRVR